LKIAPPFIDQVYGIRYEHKTPRAALDELLGREQKSEQA